MLFLASNGTTILCPSINWSEGEGPQVVDRCGRLFTFDDQHKRIREDPRMTEILEAAASSTSYSEAVKAKLEGLSAEEVKQLPLGHGAREYQRWWNTMGVLDDKEDTILEAALIPLTYMVAMPSVSMLLPAASARLTCTSLSIFSLSLEAILLWITVDVHPVSGMASFTFMKPLWEALVFTWMSMGGVGCDVTPCLQVADTFLVAACTVATNFLVSSAASVLDSSPSVSVADPVPCGPGVTEFLLFPFFFFS